MAIPEFKRPAPSRAELAHFAEAKPETKSKMKDLAAWLKELRQMMHQDPEKAKQYRPPAELLQQFYADLEKEYEEMPLSKDEIEREFTSENLAKLSLEEYVVLLRRVPPRFVTHVTRQGIRDHFSHHQGDRNIFNHGFEKILEAGKLQSVLEKYLQGTISREAVKTILKEHLKIPAEFGTIEEAHQEVDDFLNRSRATNLASSQIADQRALHVAMDFVADHYYGGESGNEMFFAYPTAYVAANNYIAPQFMAFPKGLRLDKSAQTSQYNDFWVKSKQGGKGELPVDAAIVFISENAKVDPATGSKYAVDKEGRPLANSEQINNLKNFISSPELRQLWPQMYKEIDAFKKIVWRVRDLEEEIAGLEQYGDYKLSGKREELGEAEKELAEGRATIEPLLSLAKSYGVTDERFYGTFESDNIGAWQSLTTLLGRSVKDVPFKKDDEWDEMAVSDNLRHINMEYKLAENTVSSREYWEGYFARTGKKPSKVLYYEQSNPNAALQAFKDRAGLSKKDKTDHPSDLREMFQDNLVSNKGMHEQMAEERAQFLEYAEEVLQELYSK